MSLRHEYEIAMVFVSATHYYTSSTMSIRNHDHFVAASWTTTYNKSLIPNYCALLHVVHDIKLKSWSFRDCIVDDNLLQSTLVIRTLVIRTSYETLAIRTSVIRTDFQNTVEPPLSNSVGIDQILLDKGDY